MKQLSSQYLAGFFDGEGCIYVSRKKGKKKNPYYNVRLSIANTDKRVIDLIENSFSGFVQRIMKDNRPNRRPYFVVEIYKRDKVLEFINMIYDHSIIKKEQLSVGKELLLHLKMSKSGTPVEDYIIKYRDNLVAMLSYLKVSMGSV